MQETVTLNTQEQKRVMVLNRILDRYLSTAEAASAGHLGDLSKGKGRCSGVWKSRTKAQSSDRRRHAPADCGAGADHVCGNQSAAPLNPRRKEHSSFGLYSYSNFLFQPWANPYPKNHRRRSTLHHESITITLLCHLPLSAEHYAASE